MKTKLIWVIVLVALVGLLVFLINKPVGPGKYDELASCINESGAKYYGAFWCPNCQNQEALFGASKRLLPYIECSTPDGRDQLPVCRDAGIEGYPTWEFADGSRLSGTLDLETLSSLTNCPLPESEIEDLEDSLDASTVETTEEENVEALDSDNV